MSLRPFRNINRKKTKVINVGDVKIGGDNPISVQSMTNTLTTDVKGTISQINAIQDEGAIIIDSSGVRVSDDETEVTLSASLETFQEILQGDLDSASAFMTGRLQLDGDMSVAMRLASVLS